MLIPKRHLLLLLCASVLGGCAHAGTRYDAVPLIPRQVLFGNPDKAGPQISADGARLAYLAPVDGVLNVWVGPLDDVEAAKPVTHDTHRGIRGYFWAYTNDHIIYVQDKDGDENWRVYCVDLASGEVKDLTPLEGMRLTQLVMVKCRGIADLATLSNMPLTRLDMTGCEGVTDLTPLQHMPLTSLIISRPDRITRGIQAIRDMPSLVEINATPAEEFWKGFDAGQFDGQ